MKKIIASIAVATLVMLACAQAIEACGWWLYQPELPQKN
jgi:cyclic lactone autoinducer peptide